MLRNSPELPDFIGWLARNLRAIGGYPYARAWEEISERKQISN